jgi:hypothetical protein
MIIVDCIHKGTLFSNHQPSAGGREVVGEQKVAGGGAWKSCKKHV